MASNNEHIIFAFDVDTGEPLAGLTPTWASLVNVEDGVVVVAQPTIREVGSGVYAFSKTVPFGKHYVGILDFGLQADPRFYTWNMRYEDSLDTVSMLHRCLGLLHENSVFDEATFDGLSGRLQAGRLRLYSTKEDATIAKNTSPAEHLTNMIAQYSVQASYNGANLRTYLVSLELVP